MHVTKFDKDSCVYQEKKDVLSVTLKIIKRNSYKIGSPW